MIGGLFSFKLQKNWAGSRALGVRQVPVLLHNSLGSFGQFLKLARPQFSHLPNGARITLLSVGEAPMIDKIREEVGYGQIM